MFPMPEKHVPITALSIIILPFTNEVVSFGLFPFLKLLQFFTNLLFQAGIYCSRIDSIKTGRYTLHF